MNFIYFKSAHGVMVVTFARKGTKYLAKLCCCKSRLKESLTGKQKQGMMDKKAE